jgi:hypothetical protein
MMPPEIYDDQCISFRAELELGELGTGNMDPGTCDL